MLGYILVYVYRNICSKWKTKVIAQKGWLAIAKLKPLSLFISLLLMLNEAFDNVRIEK